jgi:hypothetical protein
MKSHEFVPFIAGISATAPTFSRNGKWVAYLSYPQHSVWRSRSDGTERMQVTFPPMDARASSRGLEDFFGNQGSALLLVIGAARIR